MASGEQCLNCDQYQTTQIILHCKHNFCLYCVSYMVLKNRANGSPNDEIICAQCNKLSKLDQESIELIQQTIEKRLIPQLDSPPTVLHKGITFSKNMASVDSFQYQTPSTNLNHKLNIKSKMKEYCQTHGMEEVAFVCMTCSHLPLCLKCILSKEHSDHDIKSFQKAVSVMLQQLDLMQFHIAEGIQLIEFKRRTVKDRKGLIQECWEKSKRGIEETFEQLSVALMKKEAELLEKCNNCYEELNDQVEEEVSLMSMNLEKLKRTKDNLQQLSGTHEEGYFDFLSLYNSCKQQSELIQNITYQNQLVLDLAVSLSQQSVIKTLQSIGNLQIQISNIRQQLRTQNSESQFQIPLEPKTVMPPKKAPRNSEPPRLQIKLPEYATKFLEKHSHHTLKQDYHSISKNTFEAKSRIEKSRLEPSGSTSHLNRRKSPLDRLKSQKQLYEHKKSKQF